MNVRFGMDFVFLPRQEYEYHELHYRYTSDEYYKTQANESEDGFSFSFIREKLPEALYHDSYDTLYQPYWQNCSAYAAVENGEILGYIELEREEWNARLRITNLLIKEGHRRKGIGKFLIKRAEEIALNEDFRLIVLETQTCNVIAIDFYLACSFRFAGTNIFFYSNDDIGEKEVMIEMVKLL